MSATRLQVNLGSASTSWGPVPNGVTLEPIGARRIGAKPLFDNRGVPL